MPKHCTTLTKVHLLVFELCPFRKVPQPASTYANRNRYPQDYQLHDPDITELGREQSRILCKHLQETLPGKLDVDLIIVSPMRRCIQTAQIGLGFLIDPPPGGRKVPIVAHAGWQGAYLGRIRVCCLNPMLNPISP